MGWLKTIGNIFNGSSPSAKRSLGMKIQCNRCGEILEARVDLMNDLTPEYGPTGDPASYRCRKVLQGSGRCFQSMELILQFDARKQLTDRRITGGRILAG
jgi:hypothetical protein